MYTEKRPWGSFTTIVQNAKNGTTVKILRVEPRQRLSLQKHSKRAETWLGLSGRGVAEVDGGKTAMEKGVMVSIPIGAAHRLSSGTGCEVLEVSDGEFNEDDIVRIEDDYGRVPETPG